MGMDFSIWGLHGSRTCTSRSWEKTTATTLETLHKSVHSFELAFHIIDLLHCLLNLFFQSIYNTLYRIFKFTNSSFDSALNCIFNAVCFFFYCVNPAQNWFQFFVYSPLDLFLNAANVWHIWLWCTPYSLFKHIHI